VALLRLRDQRVLTVVNIHGMHESEKARAEQIVAAFCYGAGQKSCILGGDFNAVECSGWRLSNGAMDAADKVLRRWSAGSAEGQQQRCERPECCGDDKVGGSPAAFAHRICVRDQGPPEWTRIGRGQNAHHAAVLDGLYAMGEDVARWAPGGRGGQADALAIGQPEATVGGGLSDHLPVAACLSVPGKVSVPGRPMAIPATAFDSEAYKRARAALAAAEWSARGDGEAPAEWLARMTNRICVEIHAAVAARKRKSRQAFGGGAGDTATVQCDYHTAMRLRGIASRLVASFDADALRASPLMHRKAGLWRLAPQCDIGAPDVSSTCCKSARACWLASSPAAGAQKG
jgi:hypothetical protein